ncbi:kinase-like domain-containing protein [Penicillium sp. IBT 18751x]|nr:kinase-like domain-containing protein [Penicillium sp. IBT 18751x]
MSFIRSIKWLETGLRWDFNRMALQKSTVSPSSMLDENELIGTREHIYVTLKTYERDSAHAEREVQVYDHLKSLKSSHTGTILVRAVLDKFQLISTDGSSFHQCLIHPPLGMSLYELRNRTVKKVFPEILLKSTLIHILLALDFLHSEAHVIHTGLAPLMFFDMFYANAQQIYKKKILCLTLKMNQFSSILSRRNFPIQVHVE